MSRESAVAAGRFAAEAGMTSRVTVRRLPAPGTPANIVNGFEVSAWSTVGTDVPFKLGNSSSSDSGTRKINVGSVDYQAATAVGKFPATWQDLRDGDYIEITAGEWPGAVFKVVEATRQDQKTARRVPVVEVERPEEW